MLDAAARVLQQRGYAGATTNRIATAAGVSVGTVYEYFSDKDAVFDALIRRELDLLVAAIRGQGIGEDVDLGSALARLIAAGVAGTRYGPDLFRALEAVPGAAFRRQLAAARELVIAQVRQVLDAHRDEIDVADVDLAAFVVVSAVEGVGANATSADWDERLVQELARLVGRYLGGPDPAPPA